MKFINIKSIAILMVIFMAVTILLSGCKPKLPEVVTESEPPDVTVSTSPSAEVFLAGGTIPASAKIYPIVDETFPMSIVNSTDYEFTDEDIWTLTHYIDVFASFDDMAGEGPLKDEADKFLTSITSDEIIEVNTAAGDDNKKLVGVQILQINAEALDDVQVISLNRYVSGPEFSADTSKDTVGVLRFKKTIDGSWIQTGIAHVKTDKTGTFAAIVDDITGQLSLVSTNN